MESTTIKEMFSDPSKHLEIPQYQRAYSWDKNQWEQYLIDLEESPLGYYLGHYLFEESQGIRLIIDGQQRLTTCVIFMRAAINTLSRMGYDPKMIRILTRWYLKDDDLGPKLRTVPYDDPIFQDVVIDGKQSPAQCHTLSADRMVRALAYFQHELSKKNSSEITSLVERLQKAAITTYNVADRSMAAQIFAYENDRGKSLTKLETIKSFLLLTIYKNCQREHEVKSAADSIDTKFSQIYETIARAELDEDAVLLNYWKSVNGYNAVDVVSEVKREIAKVENPIEWIKTFASHLADAFYFVETFSSMRDEYPIRLRMLNNLSLAYPFLIKAHLSGIGIESKTFTRLLMLLENVTFRSLIRGGRADIQTRLNDHLLAIKDEPTLNQAIARIVEAIEKGWWGYWSDAEVKRCLGNWFYGNRVDNYLLWQYELSLYGNGYSGPVAITAKEMMKSESIEHIAPQTPANGDEIANGYGRYVNSENPDDGIESGGWMNRIGNLMLASQSQNSALGNKPFDAKLKDYQKCILRQQQKIGEYAEESDSGESVWTIQSIKKRHNDIVSWALNNWCVNKILTNN